MKGLKRHFVNAVHTPLAVKGVKVNLVAYRGHELYVRKCQSDSHCGSESLVVDPQVLSRLPD